MAQFDQSAEMGAQILMKKLIIPRMNDLGISRYRLAKILDVPDSTIKHWLEGKHQVTLHDFLRILGALEVKPYFVPKEDDDTPDTGRIHFN